MKKMIVILTLGLATLLLSVLYSFAAQHSAPETAPSPAGSVAGETVSLEKIMDRVEARYAGAGFSVRFFQSSTLKAMDITDTATGSMFVKRPGMMRWEYEKPSPQLIVADNKDLWIYRPEDNQVSHGASPAFFGGGKGAGFLSDITRIRKDFDVSLEGSDPADGFKIKLVPKSKTYDVTALYLTVSGATAEILTLVTHNAYGDETRFEFTDYRFNQEFSPGLFQFVVPKGAEVLTLDQ